MPLDCITPTMEQLPESEDRVILNRAFAAGERFIVFESPIDERIDVVEIQLEPVGATALTIFKEGIAATPPWDLLARQSITDAGFILSKRGKIEVQSTAATTVLGLIRWRKHGCN